MEYFYTCAPEADGSLAGVPARIAEFNDGEFILEFVEGSRLAVTERDLEYVGSEHE